MVMPSPKRTTPRPGTPLVCCEDGYVSGPGRTRTDEATRREGMKFVRLVRSLVDTDDPGESYCQHVRHAVRMEQRKRRVLEG